MKTIEYVNSNGRMVGQVREQPYGAWSAYRGFIGCPMAYCGDYESVHHAAHKMESEGWKEVKRNF